ncbi:MAG TPA: YIP1 family protein [Candidatus Limnocylindrales bacterium]|jgi:hypothetical protein|nr:YIP1 family protein [Candidatus Limnocylindrales bacterium]
MNEGTVKIEAPAQEGLSDAPAMSAPATLLGIFTSPRQTFRSLAARPRVLAPILAVLVFQILFGLVLAQSGILKNDTVAKLEAKNTPQEQIDKVSEMMDGPMKYAFVIGGPIVLTFSLLLTAALIYFMANLMLGARLRFIHYLCIAAYGSVVGIADQVVRMALAYTRGTLLVHLGVGAFLGEELNPLMRVLDTATDPLLLWAVGIQALGVAVIARKSFGFGALAVLPGFLILVSLSALQQ